MEKAILLAKAYDLAYEYVADISDMQSYAERYYEMMLVSAEKLGVLDTKITTKHSCLDNMSDEYKLWLISGKSRQ